MYLYGVRWLALLLLLIPSAAAAEEDPVFRAVKPERRNGIVPGFQVGFGLAGASGYPNNARLLGNPDYFSKSSLLPGHSESFFLLGSFTDWLSFGPLVNIATFENDTWKSIGFGIGFRAEVFPLVPLHVLPDLSTYAQLGIGKSELRAKGDYPTADGAQSFLGFGLHYEFRLFRLGGGHTAAGPFLEYDAIRAESAERHWASVGLRLAFYTGRVTADQPIGGSADQHSER